MPNTGTEMPTQRWMVLIKVKLIRTQNHKDYDQKFRVSLIFTVIRIHCHR